VPPSAFHPSFRPSLLASSRRQLASVLAVLAAATGACTEDGDPPSDETWQLPCASNITVTDGEWSPEFGTATYSYAGRHLTRVKTAWSSGGSSVTSREWDGDHLVRIEFDDGFRHTDLINTFRGALKTRVVRRDISGPIPVVTGTWDLVYDDGVLVGERIEWPNSRPGDVRTLTITGTDTARSTWRGCWMSEPTCDTQKIEHPPGDLDHWTRWEIDNDTDGFIDEIRTASYDDHGLPLEWTRTNAAFITGHEFFIRLPDGSAISRTYEDYDYNYLVEENFLFACDAAGSTARATGAAESASTHRTSIPRSSRELPETLMPPLE
jgi:hypothetical protein